MPETRTSFVHRYLGSLICKNPRMLLLSAAVVQGLLLGAQEPSSPAAKPVLTTQRTWTLSYQNCRVPQGNEVRTPDGFTYMPVPDSPDGSVRAKKVDLIGVMDRRQRRVEGIQLELFRVATERRFSLSLEVEVDVLDYRKMLKSSSFPGSWPKELWEFLGPSETRFYQKKNLLRIDPKSPTVRKAATGLRRGTRPGRSGPARCRPRWPHPASGSRSGWRSSRRRGTSRPRSGRWSRTEPGSGSGR